MPYDKQQGSKTSHSDFVRNPEVRAFLEQCQPPTPPSEQSVAELVSLFVAPPVSEQKAAIKHVLATDGSFYASSIDKRLPSIQVCFLKFSTILIEMAEYLDLEDSGTGMIDPFRVAAMQRNHDPLTLVLPLANFKLPQDDSVQVSFRRQMDSFLASKPTRFIANDPATSLLATLAELAQLRLERDSPPGMVKIPRCTNPDCERINIYLDPERDTYTCPSCGKPLYISDCLRLWDGVNDYHAQLEPATRFMSCMEHLIVVHYLRFLEVMDPTLLGELAIFIDGPLALFWNTSWLHAPIMRYIYHLRGRLRAARQSTPIVIGLQKTGYVVEFMKLLNQHLPANRLFSITDEFRHKYMGIERSRNGFGNETYYGHDFIYKSKSGKIFVFALPYPFAGKKAEPNFKEEKAKLERYPELPQVLNLIEQLETDLYRDAVVPIALAHRFAAISLQPGGKVLDMLGRRNFAIA